VGKGGKIWRWVRRWSCYCVVWGECKEDAGEEMGGRTNHDDAAFVASRDLNCDSADPVAFHDAWCYESAYAEGAEAFSVNSRCEPSIITSCGRKGK